MAAERTLEWAVGTASGRRTVAAVVTGVIMIASVAWWVTVRVSTQHRTTAGERMAPCELPAALESMPPDQRVRVVKEMLDCAERRRWDQEP